MACLEHAAYKNKAMISKQTVEKRKKDDVNKINYHNAIVGAV